MRKLMWFALGATAACGLSAYLLPMDWIGICTAASAVLFTALMIPSLFHSWAKPAVAALLGATMLFGWNYGFQAYYLAPVAELEGQTVELSVTLTDYSRQTEYGISVEGFTQIGGKTYRIQAYANDASLSLKPGDSLIGPFRLRNTTGVQQEATYHKGNGIFLLAYPNGDIYHRIAPDIPWYGYPAMFAAGVQDVIHSIFPEDTVAFAQALLLGDTDLLDYETDTAFKLSGIRHIVAVSGLHVSILFSLIYGITGRRKWLSALMGLPILVLFAAITGF